MGGRGDLRVVRAAAGLLGMAALQVAGGCRGSAWKPGPETLLPSVLSLSLTCLAGCVFIRGIMTLKKKKKGHVPFGTSAPGSWVPEARRGAWGA